MADLITDATLNGGSISITVKWDTDGDGSADGSETVSISGGTNTTQLSNAPDDALHYALGVDISGKAQLHSAEVDTSLDATRSVTSHASAIHSAASRGGVQRHVTTNMTGEGSVESEAEITEMFPDKNSSNLDFTFVTSPTLGFASEWVYEDSNLDSPTAFTVILDINYVSPFTMRLQYDADGNGVANYTTEPTTVNRDNMVNTWDELGDDGHYRIIISSMRPDNHLRGVTMGPTRY